MVNAMSVPTIHPSAPTQHCRVGLGGLAGYEASLAGGVTGGVLRAAYFDERPGGRRQRAGRGEGDDGVGRGTHSTAPVSPLVYSW